MNLTPAPSSHQPSQSASSNHIARLQCWILLLTILLCDGCSTLGTRTANTGPWNLKELESPPAYTTGSKTGLVEEVYFQGPSFQGKPTRVFAYLARPATATGKKSPAMVLVHGGGGKAFREWAEHWAKRGYVAIAMDLAGNGPSGRLPDGGPDQSDTTKFRNFTESDSHEMWTYHAVANVIRAHSLLRSLPDVDARRTGLTGISWGGYLTCLVASLDHRFQVAVPVYGCGFLGDNSVWRDGSLAAMTAPSRARWLSQFDPGQYLSQVRCPILFLNGTTDFAYPLDSYQKSYNLVPERFRHTAIVTNLPHGHIWTFREVDAFVDHAVKTSGAKPLTTVGEVQLRRADNSGTSSDQHLEVRVNSVVPIQDALLCYTTDSGPWNKRQWLTSPAKQQGSKISARLPTQRPLVAYLALIDERGLRVSSDFVSLGNIVRE